MDFITTLITHIATIVSIGAMFYLISIFVLKAEDDFETIMRVLAFSVGLLVFLGGKSTGVSMPALILSSIDSTGGIISALIQYIFPAIAGSLITFFLFRSIKKSQGDDNKIIYFLIFVSTLVALLFSDIYFGNFTIESEKSIVGTNISFVAGIIFTLLFKVDIVKSIYEIISDGSNNKNNESKNKDDKDSWKNKY